MKHPHDCSEQNTPAKEGATPTASAGTSRRSFLSKVGVGGAAAVALAAIPFEPLIEGKHGEAEASVVPYSSSRRTNDSWHYRECTAEAEKIDVGVLPDNGDSQRFTDFSGSWSKCLKHDYLGIVNRASWLSLVHALQTGRFSDFENILVGNPGGPGFTGTLNGPMGALAFDLEGLDAFATVIPPAPSVSSAQTAAEQVEHYWAALMRDVHFEDYPSSSLAAQACADLNNLSYVRQHNSIYPYPVTPQNLFRGEIVPGDGSVQGPYLSQFLMQPSFMGAQPMSQQMVRFLSVSEGGADYLTDPVEYLNVESGFPPSFSLRYDPVYRHMRMGRDLNAYTHVDALHQAYFVACLVLAEIGAPANPGNPYIGSQTQHGFGTFGSPQGGPVDAKGTVPEMATRALKAAWFHKWVVNLRQRPEEIGALLQARMTNQHPMPQAAVGTASRLVKLGRAADHSRTIRQLFVAASISRGGASTPLLPHRTRNRGRSLHHSDQVLLRLQSAHPAAAVGRRLRRHGAHPRRSGPHPVHRFRPRQPHHQRRTVQTGMEHQRRTRHPRWYPLPQLHLLLDPAGRAGGDKRAEGSRQLLR